MPRLRLLTLVLTAALMLCASSAFGTQSNPASSAATPITGNPVPALAALDQAMLSFLEQHGIPGGGLAVMQNGRLLLNRGYGWADPEMNVPWEPESLCRIASMTKPFTAMGVMLLVQSGKLTLDTPAIGLLGLTPFLRPETQPDPRLGKITVRHLLTHSGGWNTKSDLVGRALEVALQMGVPAPATRQQLLQYRMGQPLDFDPGTEYSYSNTGYFALGQLIEKLSGMSYESYIQTKVMAPLGITRMRLAKSRKKDRVPGEVRYHDGGNRMAFSVFAEDRRAQVPFPYGGFALESVDAAGGWIGSVRDLAKFTDGMVTRPILNEASQRQVFFQNPGMEPGTTFTSFGGWRVTPGQAGVAFGHTGSLEGSCGGMFRRWDGITFAALVNKEKIGGGTLASELQSRLNSAIDGLLARR